MSFTPSIRMAAVVLAVLGAVVCAISFSGRDNAEEADATRKKAFAPAAEAMETPTARPVPTAVAELVRDGHSRVFPGKVRANRRAELSFSVGGRLVELNAQEGVRVRRGQVLARLDQRDFLHERDSAKASFVQAERNLTKFRSLYAQRVVTETQFEDVRTAYDIALADLHIREKALADTLLRAPFDGVVVNRLIENFGHVKKDETVLSLQDISRMEVVIQVPERLIARDGTDGFSRLRVHFDADPEQGRWFDATVREYSVESDKVTRTYDVVVALTTPEDLQVFPGMTASVRAVVGKGDVSTDATTRIPLEAVWNGVDGGSYVWVIAPGGGHPVKARVEIASLRGACAEIRSGLEPGMHVAVAGVHALSEEVLVRPLAAGEGGLDG